MQRLKNIKNIIFDLGGVILDLDIQKAKDELRNLGLKEIDNLFGLGHAGSFFMDHEQGGISDDEFVSEISRRLGGEVTDDKIRSAWNSMLLRFPLERIDFLKKIIQKVPVVFIQQHQWNSPRCIP